VSITPGFEPRWIVVISGNDRRLRTGLAHPAEKPKDGAFR